MSLVACLLLLLLLALPAAADDPPGPYRLPLGDPARRDLRQSVPAGRIADLRRGREATVAGIVRAADGVSFVFLGETHTNPDHHRLQAEVIEGLVRRGRRVIVGMEMFTRPLQPALDRWSRGELTEEEFLRQADWEKVWGFPYELYRPVLEAVRRHRLPLVALNVPRTLVRTVGREGLAGLSAEERATLPQEIDLSSAEHRAFFDAMMAGHPGTVSQNIYAAQVVWDVAMADSVLTAWRARPRDQRDVFVVIAGSGHLLYGLGINDRLARRLEAPMLTVAAIESADGRPVEVSRALGDFVLVAPRPAEPKEE